MVVHHTHGRHFACFLIEFLAVFLHLARVNRTKENAIDLNKSNIDSFVERMAKNNRRDKDDCQKVNKIILMNCFVFVIT